MIVRRLLHSLRPTSSWRVTVPLPLIEVRLFLFVLIFFVCLFCRLLFYCFVFDFLCCFGAIFCWGRSECRLSCGFRFGNERRCSGARASTLSSICSCFSLVFVLTCFFSFLLTFISLTFDCFLFFRCCGCCCSQLWTTPNTRGSTPTRHRRPPHVASHLPTCPRPALASPAAAASS